MEPRSLEPEMTANNRVLVVDDERDAIELYRAVLVGPPRRRHLRRGRKTASRQPSYEVHTASCGQEAVAKVRSELESGRRFACGVFDMRMPGMDGLQTIRRVRELDPLILCAVCTAHTDRSVDEINEAFPIGAEDEWDYLQKPIARAELIQKVRNLVSSWNRRKRERGQRRLAQRLIELLSGMQSTCSVGVDRQLASLVDAAVEFTGAEVGALVALQNGDAEIERSWGDLPEATPWSGPDGSAPGSEPVVHDGWVGLPFPVGAIRRQLWLPAAACEHDDVHNALQIAVGATAGQVERARLDLELRELNGALKGLAEMRSREADLSRLEAGRSARLATLGQMTAGIAHEINNPLCIIKLANDDNLESSVRVELDRAALLENAGLIDEQVARIRRLTSQLQSLTRGAQESRETVDLTDVVRSTTRMMAHHWAHTDSKVETRFTAGLPKVLIDRLQVSQIVGNLLNNALDATGGCGNGAVTVELDMPRGGNHVVLEVRDNGPGMSEEILECALDPFFTTKDAGQGTGLGLTVVDTLVRRHDGVLTIETVEGQGTTVRASFPAIELETREKEEPEGRLSALIVRRDSVRAQSTAAAFVAAGVVCEITGTRTEALNLVASAPPDLIATDLETCDVPTWQFLDLIRGLETPPKIFLVRPGEYTGETTELGCLGIDGLISEVLEPDQLDELLRRNWSHHSSPRADASPASLPAAPAG